MFVHGGERRQAEAPPDFFETWRVAVLWDELVEVVENLALPFRERKHRQVASSAVETIRKRKAKVNRADKILLVRLPISIPARQAARFDVVGFGQNSVDLLAVVTEYPQNNTKQPLEHFAQLPGGQIATAMAVCSRLGWRASYIGAFGDDEFGRWSRDSLIGEGVDVSQSRVLDGVTNQFAVVLVSAASGDRTVLWHRHSALTFDPASVPRPAMTSGRLLVLDGHDTPAAIEAARAA